MDRNPFLQWIAEYEHDRERARRSTAIEAQVAISYSDGRWLVTVLDEDGNILLDGDAIAPHAATELAAGVLRSQLEEQLQGTPSMSDQRCQFPYHDSSKYCTDRAEWLIGTRLIGTTSPIEQEPLAVCGMHAMRYKEPDGFTRTPLEHKGRYD